MFQNARFATSSSIRCCSSKNKTPRASFEHTPSLLFAAAAARYTLYSSRYPGLVRFYRTTEEGEKIDRRDLSRSVGEEAREATAANCEPTAPGMRAMRVLTTSGLAIWSRGFPSLWRPHFRRPSIPYPREREGEGDGERRGSLVAEPPCPWETPCPPPRTIPFSTSIASTILFPQLGPSFFFLHHHELVLISPSLVEEREEGKGTVTQEGESWKATVISQQHYPPMLLRQYKIGNWNRVNMLL